MYKQTTLLLSLLIVTGSMKAMERNWLTAGTAVGFTIGGIMLDKALASYSIERRLDKSSNQSLSRSSGARSISSFCRSTLSAIVHNNPVSSSSLTTDDQRFFQARSARWGGN